MKSIFVLAVSFFTLTSFASLNESALESAAGEKLGISDLEAFEWKIEQGPLANIYNVEFSYDLEFFDVGLDIVTFTCSGTVKNGATPEFISLDCEEEEPLLWDEF